MQPQPWIKARVKQLGKTLSGLGKAMGGLDGSRITEIMAGTRRVQPPEVEPMAEYLEMPPEDVYSRLFGTTLESRSKNDNHRSATTKIDTSATVLIPLWQIRSLGGPMGGETLLLSRSDSWAAAPAELRLVPDSLAVPYWDDLHKPFVRRGALLFLNPSSVPRNGDWCLFASEVDIEGGTIRNPRMGVLLPSTATLWKIQQGIERASLSVLEFPKILLIEWIKP